MDADVLVISCKEDPHADNIIGKINERGGADRIARLNTEDFANNCMVCSDGYITSVEMIDSGKTINNRSLKSVWYRRPVDVEITDEPDPYTAGYIEKQCCAFLRGFYYQTQTSAKWINPLPCLQGARQKLQQLQAAREIGLAVPKTIITNRRDALLRFLDSVSLVCTKSTEEQNVFTDKGVYPFLTQMMDKNAVLENIGSIERCPTLFQEYIDKQYDIRVVVMWDNVFAVQIHSQEHPQSRIDFRGIAPVDLAHQEHQLPASVADTLRMFVRRQGLVFSAIDLVLSKNGEYYFLENNPNGQWLWLEILTGIKMSDVFIDLLLLPDRIILNPR